MSIKGFLEEVAVKEDNICIWHEWSASPPGWCHWDAPQTHWWNGQKSQDTSECAAESRGFMPKWRGCQFCVWTGQWIKNRVFPDSWQVMQLSMTMAIPFARIHRVLFLPQNKPLWVVPALARNSWTPPPTPPKKKKDQKRGLNELSPALPTPQWSVLFSDLMQGWHAKVYSLLSNPEVAAELHTYVHSNKWAMDPAKFTKFSQIHSFWLLQGNIWSTSPKIPHGFRKPWTCQQLITGFIWQVTSLRNKEPL